MLDIINFFLSFWKVFRKKFGRKFKTGKILGIFWIFRTKLKLLTFNRFCLMRYFGDSGKYANIATNKMVSATVTNGVV